MASFDLRPIGWMIGGGRAEQRLGREGEKGKGGGG